MDGNPFDKVFDKIAELMQLAYDNAHKPVPLEKQKELDEHLNELEKQVAKLRNMSDEFVKDSGITDYAFHAMLEDTTSEKITSEDRTLLKRAEDLKKEAEKASKDAYKAADDAKASGKSLSGKKKAAKATTAQTRKGKFRTQGGYKNWKPL